MLDSATRHARCDCKADRACSFHGSVPPWAVGWRPAFACEPGSMLGASMIATCSMWAHLLLHARMIDLARVRAISVLYWHACALRSQRVALPLVVDALTLDSACVH